MEAGQLDLFPSRPRVNSALFYLVKCYIILVPYVRFVKQITEYVLLLPIRASIDNFFESVQLRLDRILRFESWKKKEIILYLFIHFSK